MQARVEGAHRAQAVSQDLTTEDLIAARRMWLAVVMQAIQDWRGGTLRARREAQHFLFEEQRAFDTVCANAGLDPENLRSRLRKIGQMVNVQGAWARPVAA